MRFVSCCSLSLLKFRMQCTLDLITYWWFLNMWTAPIYCGACFIELHELSCGAGWYKYAHTQTNKNMTTVLPCKRQSIYKCCQYYRRHCRSRILDHREHRVVPFHDWRTPYSIHLACTICSVLFCASLHRGLKPSSLRQRVGFAMETSYVHVYMSHVLVKCFCCSELFNHLLK